MFNADIKFTARRRELTQPLIDAVWDYARVLRDNGQLGDDYSLSRKGLQVHLLGILPEKCSLESRFHDASGKAKLGHALKLTTGPAVKKLIGKVEDEPPSCACQQRPSVHIFTHMFDDSTPLACGTCRRTIPFYRLRGLSRASRDGLLHWQWAYQACDDLFIHSGFGERWAYRQMSDIRSGLTIDGLELRAQVEQELKLPVFYFLHRYWGRSETAERKRRCPGCGGEWLLPKSEGCFDFRCERCRLLSCLAP